MKEWITGRNPVYEVLAAGKRDIFQLKIASGAKVEGKLAEIIALAKKRKITPVMVQRFELDRLDENHQGVAAEVSGYSYCDLTDIEQKAEAAQEQLFILVLDTLQNPQNLGTLIRTAEAAGVHGIIIPLAHTVAVTPAVVHSSVGATEHMLICQMNLSQAFDELHDRGTWIVGLEGGPEATPIDVNKLTGNLAIVVGSEGEGLRKLTRQKCDELSALPMKGKIESLNAAVAGSIVIYLSRLQRDK